VATMKVTLDPISRVEGHLRIDLELRDNVIAAARSSGTSFRGFEPILLGRDPRDAVHLTQRICGVCPVPHARASSAAIEIGGQIQVNSQARLIRNLIEAANFIESHLLHFYLMALPDYVSGLPTAGAWPAHSKPAVWEGRNGLDAARLAANQVKCLAVRRDCQQICTLLGGKMPHPVGIIVGGATTLLTADGKSKLSTWVSDIANFVNSTYKQDVEALALAFPEYLSMGASGATFLSFGGYPEADGTLLFRQGVFRAGANKAEPLDPAQVTESVAHSKYDAAAPVNPSSGSTNANQNRADTYSWSKSPRLGGQVCEVGPLARSVVAGLAFSERGAHARHLARVAEAVLLVARLPVWVAQLEVGASACPTFPKSPQSAVSMGLVEAPRGALGHWLTIEDGKIARYQVISPTTWNGSPRDEQNQPGALEKSLEGVHVNDPNDPIEALRIVHSFDPCVQCAVH
jgi:hydrogenase large subunit